LASFNWFDNIFTFRLDCFARAYWPDEKIALFPIGLNGESENFFRRCSVSPAGSLAHLSACCPAKSGNHANRPQGAPEKFFPRPSSNDSGLVYLYE